MESWRALGSVAGWVQVSVEKKNERLMGMRQEEGRGRVSVSFRRECECSTVAVVCECVKLGWVPGGVMRRGRVVQGVA